MSRIQTIQLPTPYTTAIENENEFPRRTLKRKSILDQGNDGQPVRGELAENEENLSPFEQYITSPPEQQIDNGLPERKSAAASGGTQRLSDNKDMATSQPPTSQRRSASFREQLPAVAPMDNQETPRQKVLSQWRSEGKTANTPFTSGAILGTPMEKLKSLARSSRLTNGVNQPLGELNPVNAPLTEAAVLPVTPIEKRESLARSRRLTTGREAINLPVSPIENQESPMVSPPIQRRTMSRRQTTLMGENPNLNFSTDETPTSMPRLTRKSQPFSTPEPPIQYPINLRMKPDVDVEEPMTENVIPIPKPRTSRLLSRGQIESREGPTMSRQLSGRNTEEKPATEFKPQMSPLSVRKSGSELAKSNRFSAVRKTPLSVSQRPGQNADVGQGYFYTRETYNELIVHDPSHLNPASSAAWNELLGQPLEKFSSQGNVTFLEKDFNLEYQNTKSQIKILIFRQKGQQEQSVVFVDDKLVLRGEDGVYKAVAPFDSANDIVQYALKFLLK